MNTTATLEQPAPAPIRSKDGLSIVNKSIAELEIDDGELRVMKQRLSAEKHALQGELAQINSQCVSRLPQKEYQRLQSRRGQIVKQLQEKEVEIGDLNSSRHEILTVLEVRKRQAQLFVPSDVRKLVEIRDRWHGFSMDKNNPKSARETAWKISQELREFLKPHFNQGQDA